MTYQEVAVVAETARADILVSLILDAVAEGRHADAVLCARRLGSAWPEVSDWCSWVVAGCSALDGKASLALRELHEIADRGGWLASSLVDDASLESVWNEPQGRELRARLADRARQPVGFTEPVVVQEASRTLTAVVTVHGNGPLPLGAQREMWSTLPDTSVYAVRSSHTIAAGTPVWADRQAARQQVRDAVALVRRTVPGVPIVLAGLGSGATISLEVAAGRVPGLDHVVACAPRVPRVQNEPSEERPALTVAIDASDAAIPELRQWGDRSDLALRIDEIDALGHAFPADFPQYITTVGPWRDV